LEEKQRNLHPWQQKLHTVIYEADTPAGKFFDVALLIAILLSILIVMLESVEDINATYHNFFYTTEWVLTGLFTLEYILRIVAIKSPSKYIFSFYGIIDLLSILPTFLELIFIGQGTRSLMVIRSLRLVRVFRVFKLGRNLGEGAIMLNALKKSIPKITVFLIFILSLCLILGTVMYIVETPEQGFTSIPRSIYWAIVTLTTVGYGDISPATALGQTIASVIMIMGYAIIAVPTGIVSNDLINNASFSRKKLHTTQSCPNCSQDGHDYDADYCKYCGDHLHPEKLSNS
jgi:voltage-gated potassium channel